MIAKLINLDDAGVEPIAVEKLPVVVGSNRDAGIVIDNQRVSGLHCLIDECDGTLVVHDLASNAGTFVNSAKVVDAPLAPGDILSMGALDFMVSYEHQLHPAKTGREGLSDAAKQNLFSD